MKTLTKLLLLLSIVIQLACQKTENKAGVFNLLPLPQEFDINGVSKLSPADLKTVYSEKESLPLIDSVFNLRAIDTEINADIIFEVDSSLKLPSGGYTMTIDEEKVNIISQDTVGLFYAFKSLKQLVMDATEQKVNLPQCTIIDYPEIAFRAIHLDIKHHREKEEYYYQLIDKLADYKINGIILEFEDKLKYQSHPLVGSEDALSVKEWENLADYAKQRFIEISPLVQGLGHASFILKHDKYKRLRDDPESDWAFNPLDPDTYELQFDLYKEAMAATPHGKYLHVGGDEVKTTGRESGKSALELQLIWLNKVCQFAAENNRTPIFWDDMPLKEAGVYESMFDSKLTQKEVDAVWAKNEQNLLKYIDQFPKNCIYMRWNYSNSDALGNAKAMQWFMKQGLQVMGATAGQTRWVLMPQEESNMNNIRSFVESSIDNNLDKILLTLWDDDSPHFELYMRGILAFSEYSWTGDKRSKDEIKAAYRHREFSHEVAAKEFAFIDDLEKVVKDYKNALLKGNKRNYLKTMDNPSEMGIMDLPHADKKGVWSKNEAERIGMAKAALEKSDSIARKIELIKSKDPKNPYRLDIYEQVNRLTAFSAKAILALNEYDTAKTEEEQKKAQEKISNLKSEFIEIRNRMDDVYAQTRLLNKPANYILDQDHHVHLANQSINFDWQFYAEMLFLEKLEQLL
ncbi:MAG: beta-N-acetylhexosaminidase [Cytophagales bacterium]|nr:beta-N-acetylhexosaminidase [Cytophagales bacterium]